MEHFYAMDTQAAEGKEVDAPEPLERETDPAPPAADPAYGYIFSHTRGKKCLVFVNSREECEAVTTSLRQYCESKHEPDRFLIHHGNLSAAYRETAEAVMKDEEQIMTTVTTATLELGIDIGKLERAFQLDAPFTVSSFLQRMALVQLYAEEHWVEPPKLDRLPFSLLYHQTMSTLAANGEMTPAQLAGRVLKLQPFRRITQDDYRILLRHLIEKDHIQRTERGGLIAGLVWVVDEVDYDRHLVYCTQVKGKVPAYFGDCPGDIQTKILERMRGVLQENAQYPYVMKNGVARLAQARNTAAHSGLLTEPLICMGGDMWALFPWLGSYAFLALERLLKIKCAQELHLSGLAPSRPYFMTFKMKADKETFYRVLKEQAEAEFDPLELVYPDEIPLFEKYDEYVPAELVRKGFAYGILAVDEMRARIQNWTGRIA